LNTVISATIRPPMTEPRIQTGSAGFSAPRFQMKLAAISRMNSDSAVLLTVPPIVICSTPGTAGARGNVSAPRAGLPERMGIAEAMQRA
jgi:hypothetical protein